MRIIIIFLVYRLNKVCYENLLKVGSYCYDDVKIKFFNDFIYIFKLMKLNILLNYW